MRPPPHSLPFLGALALTGLVGCGSGSSSNLGSIADPDDPDPVDPTDPITMTSFVPVDTGQDACFDDVGVTADPAPGEPFHGQDAQSEGAIPHYVDNGDGTVTDLVTGLMWQQDPGPKDGDPNDYPFGHGPQGDAIRIFNLVRRVRDASD